MKSTGILLLCIFTMGVSPADEIDDLIVNGDYIKASYRIEQKYSNDSVHLEHLFAGGLSELSGENSASYLKDYINKSSSESYITDWAKLILGKYYLAQRLYVVARKQLESIPDKSPLAPEAKYLAGRCYLLSGEYEQAIAIFKSTIDHFDDSNPDAWPGQRRIYDYWARLGLADSYLAQADYDKAGWQYQELLMPELEDNIYPLALLGLAETAAKHGDRDDADRYNKLYKERYQTLIEPSAYIQPAQIKVSGEKPPESSRATAHRYYIQIGVFSKQDNAIRTSSLYQNSGYNVYMEDYMESGKKFYRILIGGYDSKQQTEFVKSRLEKASGEKYILLER